jgi:undecaprenyl-diphosphatase
VPGDLIKRVAHDGPRLLIPAAALTALMITVGLLLTHVVPSTAIGRWDAQLPRDLVAHRQGGGVSESGFITTLSATPTIIALTIVAVIVLRWRLGRWRESLFVVFAVVGEVLVFTLTTLFVDRPRPNVPHLDAAPPTSSFPSGHAGAAVCFYGAVAIVIIRQVSNRWVQITTLLVATAIPLTVASSRVYRGMHYPTDAVSGLLLGAIWLAVVTHVLLNYEDHTARRQSPQRSLREGVR